MHHNETTCEVTVADLAHEALDYWVYRCAALNLKKAYDPAEFESGYRQGQFRFSEDATLLNDLLETYQIRLQRLADEWLASGTQHSQYGQTALTAACRWLVCYTYGAKFNPNNL